MNDCTVHWWATARWLRVTAVVWWVSTQVEITQRTNAGTLEQQGLSSVDKCSLGVSSCGDTLPVTCVQRRVFHSETLWPPGSCSKSGTPSLKFLQEQLCFMAEKKKFLKFSFLKWTTTSPVVVFFNSWRHQSLLSSPVITITQQVFVSHICEAFLANQNTPLKPLCLLWQGQQPKLPKYIYIFFLNQI